MFKFDVIAIIRRRRSPFWARSSSSKRIVLYFFVWAYLYYRSCSTLEKCATLKFTLFLLLVCIVCRYLNVPVWFGWSLPSWLIRVRNCNWLHLVLLRSLRLERRLSNKAQILTSHSLPCRRRSKLQNVFVPCNLNEQGSCANSCRPNIFMNGSSSAFS